MDDILNINNVYFDNMVSQIYPLELQLNKANTSDTEAAFLDLHLSISNDIVSTKIYDKRDDFDFEIVNFPFLDGDVPRSTSTFTVMPAKSDSDVMFCLQSYQGLITDGSLVY